MDNLIALGGDALNGTAPTLSSELSDLAGHLADKLTEMLSHRNGFYAFESGLFPRPATSNPEHLGLDGWNEPSLRISSYEGMAGDARGFAEAAVTRCHATHHTHQTLMRS